MWQEDAAIQRARASAAQATPEGEAPVAAPAADVPSLETPAARAGWQAVRQAAAMAKLTLTAEQLESLSVGELVREYEAGSRR